MNIRFHTHIDNVSYSFPRNLKSKQKIEVNWPIVNELFHKFGEIRTPSGVNLSKYKLFIPHPAKKTGGGGISYKIVGNIVTISLAKAIFTSHRDKITYYKQFTEALMFLFDNDILLTKARKSSPKGLLHLEKSRIDKS